MLVSFYNKKGEATMLIHVTRRVFPNPVSNFIPSLSGFKPKWLIVYAFIKKCCSYFVVQEKYIVSAFVLKAGAIVKIFLAEQNFVFKLMQRYLVVIIIFKFA